MKRRNLQIVKVLFVLLLLSAWPLQAQNLVPNGNFDAGNHDFGSDYEKSWGLGGDNDTGKYYVGLNASQHSSTMFNLNDHTSGQGKYMVVNGSTDNSQRVWYNTIDVQQYSYYDLSLWMTNLSRLWIASVQRSKINIFINNVEVVHEYYPPVVHNDAGEWNLMPTVNWYSGTNTSAYIAIYDVCEADNGNDFGLDDISFTYLYTNVVQAYDDEVTTCFETPVNINPMSNDVISPSSLTSNVVFTLISQPNSGSLQLLSGTNYRYTPNTGFVGTDSFMYRLRFGTGSDAITAYGVVTITVNARPQRTIDQHACENYTWSYTGQTYSQTGQYTHIKTSPNACDSLLILNLTIHHGEEETLPAVVECDEYIWHGTTYTQSGTYDYITTTQWGCELIQHLPLTINHGDTLDIPVSACEEYTWNGQTYTNSGTYTRWTTNSFNCDRLERLILTISDRFRHVDNLTECDSYYWPRTHQTYYQSTIDSVCVEGPPGGCDSTFVLNLTIHYADTLDVEPVEACDSYEWHGQNYTTSGIKTYQTTNQYGCDRLERLNLTIHNSESIDLPAVTDCDDYYWHGQTYTQSGIAVFDTVNQYGCNLQYVLPLTINHSDTADWVYETACDSYFWYGQTITETGSYFHHSTNEYGCDHLERLYVTINYNTVDTLEPVTDCDSYWWHGEEISQTGWRTYEETDPDTGCTHKEVVFVTINPSSEPDVLNKTSCEPFTWFDSTYYDPGIYFHMMSNAAGCDSLCILYLEMGDMEIDSVARTGCEFFEWRGNIYFESNVYYDSVQNPNGCDSLFILNLTIRPNYEGDTVVESCNTFTWFDETFDESGDYSKHFTAITGCDSLVVMHLTIHQPVYHEFEQQTCQFPFSWNGIDYYYEDDYEQTFETANGCDSIVTMHLVLKEALTSEFDRQSCDSITWYEHYCDHNGDYHHTFTSVQGCDSIVTMHFSLTDEIVYEFDTLACTSFNWYGYSCDQDGEFTHPFQTPQGCDSTVIMHLHLNVTQVNTQFVSACDSALYNGIWYNEPGNYYVYLDTLQSQTGCDSVIYRVNLTVHNSEQMAQIEGSHNVYVASNLVSGIYRYTIDTAGIVSGIVWTLTNPDWQVLDQDAESCRILVTMPGSGILKANFQVADCGEMERQFNINAGFFGIDDHQSIEAHVYPNPTKGMVTVEAAGIESIRVINMIGQTLEVFEDIGQDQVNLSLSPFGPSVYLIEIKTVNGMAQRRVVLCR